MSDTWGGGLDPQTQAIIEFLLSQGGGGQMPWEGAAGADVLGQLSFGFDPSAMQQESLAGWIPPSQDPEDAGSLEEAGRQGNYLQDFLDLSADPMVAALMGGGSFAQDSFAPTVERELIARPATQQFNQWLTNAQQGEVSFEGIIAQAVQNGRSPRTAVSQMRQLIQQADANAESDNPDPDLQAQADQIRSFLPPSFQYGAAGEPLTGDAAINWQSAFDDADDLVQAYQEEQETQPGPIGATFDDEGNMTSSGGNIVVGPDGQFYRETTTESPLAEKYRELGIPLPTEQYEPGDILGAGWQQANQAYLDTEPQMDEAYQQLRTDRDMALENATGNNLSQSDVFRMDTMDDDLTRAVGAAPTQVQVDKAPLGPSWWDQQPDNSAAGRLQGVGDVVGPAGSWFQDLFRPGPGSHEVQTLGGGATDVYGMPTSGGDGTLPIANDVVTGLDLDAQAMARLIDQWGGGLAAGAQSGVEGVGGFDPLGAVSDASGEWWQNWTGANREPADQAGGQQYSPGGADDPFAGMSPTEIQAAVTANPALQTPAWQELLGQGGGGGVGNAGTGVGGGGAGGMGAPRTLADLGDDGTDYLQYWLDANGDESYQQYRQNQIPLPPPGDANTLAMLQQTLSPQDQRISDFENQRAEQFALPSSNASPRTGPEPSEAATRPRGLEMLWPGGQQRQPASQESTNQMLRMLFGMDPEDRKVSGGTKGGTRAPMNAKQRLMSGHRASAVDSYRLSQRANARTISREMARSNTRANQQYRSLYGRDYWQARGYAEALQSLGVTPTSVALANRTGGVNALFRR